MSVVVKSSQKVFTAEEISSLTGISVPCGATADGLPIGMQIYAPAFGEERLLQAAHAFEQARLGARAN